MPSRPLRALVLLCAALACGLPRDPEGTLDRVRGGTLRVGVIHAPPWVTIEHRDGDPDGLDDDSPFGEDVGFICPYVDAGGRAHVVAGPPGENAWLRVVEAYFNAHAPEET